MKPLFATQRLIVYPSSLDHYDEVYKLVSDPQVMRYVGNGVRTPEVAREGLEKAIQHHKKHGFGMGSVFDKQSGEFIGRAGMCYLELNDTQPDVEIGYVLHERHWNKGFATELAKGALNLGFNEFNFDKLIAVTYPENLASRHVLEKAGMRQVGEQVCYGIVATKFELLRKERSC